MPEKNHQLAKNAQLVEQKYRQTSYRQTLEKEMQRSRWESTDGEPPSGWKKAWISQLQIH